MRNRVGTMALPLQLLTGMVTQPPLEPHSDSFPAARHCTRQPFAFIQLIIGTAHGMHEVEIARAFDGKVV